MKTKAEVVTKALRRLRIVAMDEAATAEQEAVASDALDGLYSELQGSYGVFLNGVDYVDDEVFLPLSDLLAAQVAADFSTQSPVSRASAIIRLRAVTNPNDFTSSEGTYY